MTTGTHQCAVLTRFHRLQIVAQMSDTAANTWDMLSASLRTVDAYEGEDGLTGVWMRFTHLQAPKLHRIRSRKY